MGFDFKAHSMNKLINLNPNKAIENSHSFLCDGSEFSIA